MEGHGIVWNLLSLGAAGAFATSRLLLLSRQAFALPRTPIYTVNTHLASESDTRCFLHLLDREDSPRRL